MKLNERQVSRIVPGLLAGLVLVYATQLRAWLGYVGIDLRDYVLPWYRHILANGRLSSLEGSFANYSPPYIYLLSAVSVFSVRVPMVPLVKLAVLPFHVLAASATWLVCRELGADRWRAWTAALLVPLLPEAMLNSFKWGQCDIIHCSLILVSVGLFLSGKKIFGMAILGAALAVKLQVVFIGPALVGLMLAGELPVIGVLAAVAAFVSLLVPAHLAGRTWPSLLRVYGEQYGYYSDLTMGAPNLYVFTQSITRNHPHGAPHAGLLLACLLSLAFIVYVYRQTALRTKVGFLLLVTAPFLFLPYVLPKMHERYFFAGNTLLALIAFFRPRLIVAAALFQTGTVLAYLPFLNGNIATNDQLILPTVLTTCGLASFAFELYRETRLGFAVAPDSAVNA